MMIAKTDITILVGRLAGCWEMEVGVCGGVMGMGDNARGDSEIRRRRGRYHVHAFKALTTGFIAAALSQAMGLVDCRESSQ